MLAFVRRNPAASACMSGTLAGSVGDAAAQLLTVREATGGWFPAAASGSGAATPAGCPSGFDWRRWAGLAGWGCFCSAGLYRPFYTMLDARVGAAVTLPIVAAKVCLDDLMFSPGVLCQPCQRPAVCTAAGHTVPHVRAPLQGLRYPYTSHGSAKSRATP